ncbi:hypothetical protein H257_00779 [Aphanomyces astaci]|uniref:Magnesium transporter n=1 Tax=Aphanomyces astaci TaxID=112090 RepID=W4HC03_APHAT|nr:hypothetical protein H257_00779 [Aphanomyces astaci]ETV89535.1 hypothetical protein H257_00779 [Aphanomyces astaci]|eukprot:XP_009821935.1 hypothetical protein H257_00779 [Aphanomyces astaci]
MAKSRLVDTDMTKYGSCNTSEPPNWVFGQFGTPTKALIEHDFCTSHEHGLLLGLDALNSKRMVLKFDTSGKMEYVEMARSDVLKVVQDATRPDKDHRKAPSHRNASVAPTSHMTSGQRLRRRASFSQLPVNAEVQALHMRDLRNLDDNMDNATSITIRRQVILVHCGPLRCVVMRNALLMFVPTGADTLIQILRDKVAQCCAEDDDIAFEFRALEAIFYTLCKLLSGDCEKLVDKVSLALTRLSSASFASGELETLTILKNKVHEFESQILDTRRILMELLDNDQDMRLLYLSKLYHNPTIVADSMGLDVEEAEALVEAYLLVRGVDGVETVVEIDGWCGVCPVGHSRDAHQGGAASNAHGQHGKHCDAETRLGPQRPALDRHDLWHGDARDELGHVRVECVWHEPRVWLRNAAASVLGRLGRVHDRRGGPHLCGHSILQNQRCDLVITTARRRTTATPTARSGRAPRRRERPYETSPKVSTDHTSQPGCALDG